MRRRFASLLGRGLKKTERGLQRKKNPLYLERLEERLALSTSPIGVVLPLFAPNQAPYGVAQADLPTSEITGLYQLILGRDADSAGQAFWSAQLRKGPTRPTW